MPVSLANWCLFTSEQVLSHKHAGQVALWKGTSKKALRKNLCSEWSSACTPGKKNMPYAGNRKDEEFTPSGQAQEEELKALKKEQTRKANAEEAAAKRRKQKKPNAEASAADVFDAGAAVTAVAGALTSWMDDVTGGLLEIYDEKFKKYMSYKESKKFLMTSFTDMYKELYTKMTMKRVKRYAKFMMKAHSPTKLQKDKKVRTVLFIVAVMAAALLAIEAIMKLLSKLLPEEPGCSDEDDKDKIAKGVDPGRVLIIASGVFFVVAATGTFLHL